jgi:putative ABC transport system ATP-binding protein
MGSRVRVEKAIKIYVSAGERVTALKDVSLTVMPGEVVAIMGPSGSGKTTLLNLIAGIDKPDAGRVIVDDLELHKLGEDELVKYRLQRVGYVFQQFNLLPTLTALENVLLPMTLAGKADKRRAIELLESVGLGDKINRLPEQLSGGEQQRLAIAVALANDPPLLVADEPTGELDIATGEEIVKLILRESRENGKTIIMSTHDPRVARMADRVVLLQDGVIVGEYEPTSIRGFSGDSALGEIHAERILADYIKQRIKELDREIEKLSLQFSQGSISIEELVKRYTEIKYLKEALKTELAKLGAGVEI